jgi:NAD(P)-dependent dehydrogenase (short-subunit alcohol dehydrogenase family)
VDSSVSGSFDAMRTTSFQEGTSARYRGWAYAAAVAASRTAVVTGANSGIGLETARGLARAGFHVVLLCRNAERAATAAADIASTVAGASTEIVLCDLSDMDSVRRAATEVEQRLHRLDVLVNNAGITIRGKRQETPAGLDLMLAANHLGPFLLTNLLLPLLRRSAPSRVVTVASDAHRWGRLDLDDLQATRGYGFMSFPRYGETKLMNILFTRALARRLEGTGVTANCVHPGAVSTNIGAPGRLVSAITRVILKSPEQGAQTSLHVATAPELAEVSGSYFADSKLADRKLRPQATDDEAGERLWAASARLVGLT